METEVMMMPLPAVDFNFDSGCTTPYLTCPSSPQPFGNYFFSAPTSPNSISATIFADLNTFSPTSVASPSPNSPTNLYNPVNDFYDFEFNFTGKQDRTPLPADELFDAGKIKPIIQSSIVENSPEFPQSPIRFGNFAIDSEIEPKINPQNYNQQEDRGRESSYKSSSIREKETRSLSPYRDTEIFYGNERNQQGLTSNSTSTSSSSSSGFSTSSGRVSKKFSWRLRDLFRSSSEGRSATKGVGKNKYSLLKKAGAGEDVKCSSFRSTASTGSAGSSRRRGPVSAHELHYTVNRAMSEEMRKKTFLPYKRGLFGCMGFNPAVKCSV